MKTIHGGKKKFYWSSPFRERESKIHPFLESLLLLFILRKKAKCGTVDIFLLVRSVLFSKTLTVSMEL